MARRVNQAENPPHLSAKTLANVVLSQTLLDAIPDATVVVDGHGTIRQINAQVELLFRYRHGDLIGQKIEILVPQRHRTQHTTDRTAYTHTPKARAMGSGLNLQGLRSDGSEFPVEISLSPIHSGEDTLVLAAIRDVTDRKRIEDDLRRMHKELETRTTQQLGEYRARLAAIIDSSEDAILSKDLDGIIISWNRGAEHIYGYTSNETVGQSISLIVPKDRPEEIPQILARVRRGENIEHYESVRVAKDGRLLDMSISISPLRDANGEIVGASVIARDITQQKKAQEHLRQTQKMEAVGRLAGGLAHDFNNILGIIRACTELLRDRVDDQERALELVGNIRKVVDRGAGLTRQLLAFSRTPVAQPQILDLNNHLKDITKLLRPLMGDDVEIGTVPRPDAAIIEVDPGQLDQIIVNLAVNARDAMQSGGRFILETNSLQLDDAFTRQHPPMIPGKYVVLAVSDNGVGMDQSILTRIFEPFFTTKDIGKGTGLGLATVYGLVKQMGGHVWVYSEPGRGTTFKIYLPSADHKLGIEAPTENTADLAQASGTTVLLVEDDDIMRDLTRQLLEDQGFRVIAMSDGKSALESLNSHAHSIDVVLTDVVMRGMSGPQLVAELSRQHPKLRVVYMSGYTGELIGKREILTEGITLLEKPFTRSALLKAIAPRLEWLKAAGAASDH
jgi:PAS domain S-box-containing protein